MFTGLIETIGTIERLTARGNYRVMTVTAASFAEQLTVGESIACDGACLSVVTFDKSTFTVEASQETLARTVLGNYRTGSRINLERALRVGDRLGGHFVAGHVDTVGRISAVEPVGESLRIECGYDARYDSLVIEKGSIAINGVSLTINNCSAGRFDVNLIPLTIAETNLKDLAGNDRVNLEFDMIGKFILKANRSGESGKVTRELLERSGW